MLDSQIAGQFNHRQLWFLSKLQQESRVTSNDIVSVWNVALRTARRDVAGLEEGGGVMTQSIYIPCVLFELAQITHSAPKSRL